MKNYNEIHLSDLTSSLQNTHVKLDLSFLDKLLKNASKSEYPASSREFALKIGGTFNEKEHRYVSAGNWLNGSTTIPFNKLIEIIKLSDYSLDYVQKHIVSIKCGPKKGEIYPKFPIMVGKELGSIVGHILGDGSIDKRYSQPFYTNSNVDLIKEFANNMESLFGVKPRIWIQTTGNFNDVKSTWLGRVNSLENIPKNRQIGLFYPRICGVVLHHIFGLFAYGKKKQITEQIKNSNKEFKIGLIRAFFDDEGSINSSSHTMRLFQDNKSILKGIKHLLSDFNIRTNPIRFYIRKNKKRHYFNITGFREYDTFNRIIGCTSSKKKEQFELLINKVKNSKYFRNKYKNYLRRVTPILGQ
jgi:hypothetical protein